MQRAPISYAANTYPHKRRSLKNEKKEKYPHNNNNTAKKKERVITFSIDKSAALAQLRPSKVKMNPNAPLKRKTGMEKK
jgi:hypothetical protein